MIIKYRDEINIQKFSIQIPDLTKKRFNKTNRFLSNFRKIEEISKFFPKHFSLRICTALNLKKKNLHPISGSAQSEESPPTIIYTGTLSRRLHFRLNAGG